MNSLLLKQLMELTEEEKAIVEQNKEVRKDIYTSQTNFVIESEKFLNKNKMITARKHTRFIDFPKHTHNYIEINYVLNGKLKQKIGNENMTLKKGELLFLNQHIEHEISACGENDIIINFIIQPHFFDYIFHYLNGENIITDFLINSLYNSTQNGHYLYFTVADVEEIQGIISKILMEGLNPSAFTESTIKLYMGLLIIELVKNNDKIKRNEDSILQHFIVVESLKYIDENYQLGTLNELAAMLKQTSSSLSKQIKRATGYTYKELQQEKRLVKAKELLQTTDLPIQTIVKEVGYDNISYFYRLFKKKYIVTPKQYRCEEATK